MRGEPPRGSQGITCVKQAHVAASDVLQFQGLFLKGAEVFRTPVGHDGPPLNSDPWDLGDVVEGWMNGSIPNHGVILSGFDEGVGRADGNACSSTLVGRAPGCACRTSSTSR